MTQTAAKPFTGRKALATIVIAFAIIIGVNLTLAFQAVSTFPGLEVKNSYVASQSFDADRAAQQALGWDVSATIKGDTLTLSITSDADPVEAEIISAVLGRATHVAADQTPALTFDGQAYTAPIVSGAGNWNLRLLARAPDGTLFRQRVIVRVTAP